MQAILLDQNIPEAIHAWLAAVMPGATVFHINALHLMGATDEVVYRWAQEREAIIVTYDEDFADARMYPLGKHYGVIRLRVWPTTTENTQNALMRLLLSVSPENWSGSLIIIDNQKIRVRTIGKKE